MTSLVLGAVQFGLNYGINNKSGRPSKEQIKKLLELASISGIKEIDTAQDYGDSEEVLGACLKEISSSFIIHSKFSDSGIPIQEALNKSLKRLGVPKLGYFYFHKFSDYLTYRSLNPKGEELKNCTGLAVSVYDEDEMKIALNDSFIKAIQLPLNLLDALPEKLHMIKMANENGQKIYIRSVFLQGLFFMELDSLPEKLKPLKAALGQIDEICRKSKLSKRDLALGFINSIEGIDGLLIGVDNEEQLRENLSSLMIQLPTAVLDLLKKITVEDKSLILPKNWN